MSKQSNQYDYIPTVLEAQIQAALLKKFKFPANMLQSDNQLHKEG